MALELKIEDTFTFKKGKIQGKIEGKIEGKKEGKKEGKIEGEILGEKKNRDKMIMAMLKKGKNSLDEIAEIAEVTVDYVKELMKKSS